MTLAILVPARSEQAINAALAALVVLNRIYLRTHRDTPRLYESGVRYRREVAGAEQWLTLPLLLQVGAGDCEDLAAARAAELIESGEDPGAAAVVRRVRAGLWHAVVRRGTGEIEDPSKALGMNGAG